MAAYGARTGVTTLLKLTKHLCGIYELFSSKINAWVMASSLTEGEKTTIVAWLQSISLVCNLLKSIPDD